MKQNQYSKILDIINEMKHEIVDTSMQQLLITGAMPEQAQSELKVLSQITGAVFNGIISLGAEVFEDENNESLVYFQSNEKKYSCAKVNVTNSRSISSKPLSASEAYSMTSNDVTIQDAPKTVAKKVTIQEFEPPMEAQETIASSDAKDTVEAVEKKEDKSTLPYSLDESFEDDSDSSSTLEETEDNDLEDKSNEDLENEESNDEFDEEESNEEDLDDDLDDDTDDEEEDDDLLFADDDFDNYPQPQTSSVKEKRFSLDDDDDNLENDLENEEKDDDDYQNEEESSEEEMEEESNEENDSTTSVVQPFHRASNWEEEPQKDIQTMIYNVMKFSVSHIDGGRPEEIIAMIAPLKISKYAIPAVPIIVALYHNGKVVTKTSYDMGDGLAIVSMDIDNFYFLCRGSFDEDGNFKAIITTTGMSTQMGDRINVTSNKSYGNTTLSNINNGHVKIKYESEGGMGSIEVFPFGTEKDDEFIVMAKNPEFCDCYYINQRSGKTGSSVTIFAKDSQQLEIIPSWDDKILEVEVFEK